MNGVGSEIAEGYKWLFFPLLKLLFRKQFFSVWIQSFTVIQDIQAIHLHHVHVTA